VWQLVGKSDYRTAALTCHSFLIRFPNQSLQWGVPKIHVVSVLGSEEGVNTIAKTHPDVSITVGVIDSELSKDGTVMPGVGDAGDRLFGTPLIEDDEELMHPSKRRKSSIDQKDMK
jgi:hypothetical protein